jgi:hypothetical protein
METGTPRNEVTHRDILEFGHKVGNTILAIGFGNVPLLLFFAYELLEIQAHFHHIPHGYAEIRFLDILRAISLVIVGQPFKMSLVLRDIHFHLNPIGAIIGTFGHITVEIRIAFRGEAPYRIVFGRRRRGIVAGI